MDRREFSTLLPALFAATALLPEAAAQQPGEKPLQPVLSSGVYKAGAPKNPAAERVSQPFIHGMLKAGNIRLEIHETTQKPGAMHEADGTHLHSEIWLVKEGVCELNINGVSHRMEAGDIGLVTAGDHHWVANAGDTRCSYFVVTVGPPE
ncbi:MAG TPA: cupin domain-containing protein [Acidobacteriaceae bacterium]